MWQAAIALANAILEEQAKREQASSDDQRAADIINAVRAAIDQATQTILDYLRQQRLDEIAGAVNGLFVTFARYAADPANNQERLVNLIDALAILIGQMSQILARIGANEQDALNVFPTYVSAVSLSAFAITDRRLRFEVNETLGGILGQAKVYSLQVRDVLRKRSDARFSPRVQTEEGELFLGYTFNGNFEVVAILPKGGRAQEIAEHVREVMHARMDAEYLLYDGVKELTEFLSAMDGVAFVALIVSANANAIVDIKPVVMVNQKGDLKTYGFLPV